MEEHLDEFETDDERIVFKRLVICYEKIGNREMSEEYMKKMPPCMHPSKSKPKPKNGKGPTVYSPNQMKCLNNVFGPKKAESIRLGGMANISPEDTKKMEPCMEQ